MTRNKCKKLSDDDVSWIRKAYARGMFTQAELGEAFGVSAPHICNIVRKRIRNRDSDKTIATMKEEGLII